jgi:uncharacterized protein YjeT (DUF2065 family)
MDDFLAALALMLVIEGLLPFASPKTMRRVIEQMTQMDDNSLRIAGLVSMVAGAVLLYFVR